MDCDVVMRNDNATPIAATYLLRQRDQAVAADVLHGRLEVARVLDARGERERRRVEALRALAVRDALHAVVHDRGEERADLLFSMQVLEEAAEEHAVACS